MAFKQTFSHRNFKIQFVGVWDTVSSVGWIRSPLRLFNLAQNSSVVRARHAISIDEHRCFFQDNLFGEPEPGQDAQQVWFAGVHSDVGGSYPQDESQLSNITLNWMLDEVGLLPDTNEDYPAGPGIRLNKERCDLIRGEWPTPPPADKDLLYIDPPPPAVVHRSLTLAWLPLEIIPHIYYDQDDADKKQEMRRVPLGLRHRKLPDRSLVHESVVTLLQGNVPKYRPKNVSVEELQQRPEDPPPMSASGTTYYRFYPRNREKNNALVKFFDRFVVTTFFAVFDVVVLLFLVALILVSLYVVIAYGLPAIWVRLPGWVHWPFHQIGRWPGMLWHIVREYLH